MLFKLVPFKSLEFANANCECPFPPRGPMSTSCCCYPGVVAVVGVLVPAPLEAGVVSYGHH